MKWTEFIAQVPATPDCIELKIFRYRTPERTMFLDYYTLADGIYINLMVRLDQEPDDMFNLYQCVQHKRGHVHHIEDSYPPGHRPRERDALIRRWFPVVMMEYAL